MSRGVSAIIPVYNGAKLIKRAIDSVLAQTHPADEVIVVDDGSTDGTSRAVQSYGTRVRYLHQKNSGVAAARNKGVREATTEWIAFLDHDDEWLTHKLEYQLAVLESVPDAALCYSAHWMHDTNGDVLLKHLPLRNLWPTIRVRNPFPPSVVILRKAELLRLGGFDERLKGASCEDWDLFARFAAAHRVVEVSEPLTNYYVTETSFSRNYRLMLPNTLSIVDRSLLVGLTGVKRAIWRRRIRSMLYYGAAISAREVGDSSGQYLRQSLWQWPFPDIAPKRFKTLAVILLRSFRAA